MLLRLGKYRACWPIGCSPPPTFPVLGCLIVKWACIKKDEIMTFAATWMDLETVILSEVIQTEQDKYRMI